MQIHLFYKINKHIEYVMLQVKTILNVDKYTIKHSNNLKLSNSAQ